MRVRRLDHFGVDVADLARAERFYAEVLGMTVAMRLPDQVLMRYGDGGGCALFLNAGRSPGSVAKAGASTPPTPTCTHEAPWRST